MWKKLWENIESAWARMFVIVLNISIYTHEFSKPMHPHTYKSLKWKSNVSKHNRKTFFQYNYFHHLPSIWFLCVCVILFALQALLCKERDRKVCVCMCVCKCGERQNNVYIRIHTSDAKTICTYSTIPYNLMIETIWCRNFVHNPPQSDRWNF